MQFPCKPRTVPSLDQPLRPSSFPASFQSLAVRGSGQPWPQGLRAPARHVLHGCGHFAMCSTSGWRFHRHWSGQPWTL
jgi:hypothetical protein